MTINLSSSFSEKLFEKQDRIKTNKDFWKFAEDDLMNGLYWEELYNKGRRVTEFKCPHSELLATQPCPVPPTDRLKPSNSYIYASELSFLLKLYH